jgi:hypothetical protein
MDTPATKEPGAEKIPPDMIVQNLLLTSLLSSPFNPRGKYSRDPEKLKELAADIKMHGVQQAILHLALVIFTPFTRGEECRLAWNAREGVPDLSLNKTELTGILQRGIRYVGLDIAPGFADEIVNLVNFVGQTDGIVMRHVLEHNYAWKDILRNALASCRVRPDGAGKYEIVFGTRRVEASKIAGKETVPAVVRELSAEEAMTLAMVENLQRTDIHFKDMMKKGRHKPLPKRWGVGSRPGPAKEAKVR